MLTKQHFITAARKLYATDDLEIDDNPKVSRSEDGAFVAAWVWVSNDDAKQSED